MKNLQKNNKQQNLALKVLFILLGVIALITIVHITLQYLNIEVYNEKQGQIFELSNRLDLDDEASFPTWISQFLFLVVCACASLIGYLQTKKPNRVIWYIIAAVALMGSIDEVATLHEYVLQSLHVLFFSDAAPTLLSNAWLIILPVALIASALFIYKAINVIPAKTLKILIIALIPYMIGSIFIDILTNSEPGVISFKDQGLLVALEETLELVGLAVVIYALLDYLQTYYRKNIKDAIKTLKS